MSVSGITVGPSSTRLPPSPYPLLRADYGLPALADVVVLDDHDLPATRPNSLLGRYRSPYGCQRNPSVDALPKNSAQSIERMWRDGGTPLVGSVRTLGSIK